MLLMFGLDVQFTVSFVDFHSCCFPLRVGFNRLLVWTQCTSRPRNAFWCFAREYSEKKGAVSYTIKSVPRLDRN